MKKIFLSLTTRPDIMFVASSSDSLKFVQIMHLGAKNGGHMFY